MVPALVAFYVTMISYPIIRTNTTPLAAHWRGRHIRRVPYGPRNVPLHERPRRIVVVARTRVNSEYEKTNAA